jgi:L-ascorbate oxidase
MTKPILRTSITSAAFLCLCAAAPLWGAQPLRRENPPKFTQQLRTEEGEVMNIAPATLPHREPLNFAEPLLKDVASPDFEVSDKARQQLIARMEKLEKTVREKIYHDGKPRPTKEALAGLHEAWENAGGDLKKDLARLLISALAEKKIDAVGQPGKQASFRVWSYRRVDEAAEGKDPLCGPPIEVTPGVPLLIPVLNLLNKDDLKIGNFPVQDPVPLSPPADPMNSPHGFDVINLHTHGLNVSPSWPADDIFREIQPYELKFFVYDVKADHPIGTFWYHPHKHGAVATQVAGGMAGALIVKGSADGGLDLLAKQQKWGKEEEPLLLQQPRLYRLQKPLNGKNPYIFRPDFFAMKDMETQGILHPDSGQGPEIGKFSNITAPPQIGELAQWMYDNLERDPDHLDEADSGINQSWLSGEFQPNLQARARGEMFRLRLIHAGIEETWDPVVTAVTFDKAKGQWIADLDPKSACPTQLIARDGMVLDTPMTLGVPAGAVDPVQARVKAILAPGNRGELLVQTPAGAKDGATYGIVNFREYDPNEKEPPLPLVLGHFEVHGDAAAVGKFPLEPKDVKPFLKTSPTAHGPETDFSVSFDDATVQPAGVNQFSVHPGTFTINSFPFPGVSKHFALHSTVDIGIDVDKDEHPIHLHVNPMWIWPAKDQAETDGYLRRGLPPTGFWTDTLLVKGADVGTMTFENWTGNTVVHCHILDHEDSGMMNTFDINDPAGFPVPPVGSLMEMPRFPQAAIQAVSAQWPAGAKLPGAGAVTVVAFLPRTRAVGTCSHCVTAVNNMAALRSRAGAVPFKIVVVTGPDDGGVEDLAGILRLDPNSDAICTDHALKAFAAVGLIDATPHLEEGVFTFPNAFKKDGNILHENNVMHGLFVVDPKGIIVSANRGFRAYDNTDQTLAEIALAADVKKALETGQAALPAPKILPTAETTARHQQKFDAFKARYESAAKTPAQ